jgi:hypothetical protein
VLALPVALLVVKYAASIVAAAYGVYATLTDFHQNKGGVRILSSKGRWGIALFLFSILLNVFSDGLKDYKEHKADVESQKVQERAINTANQTAASLHAQLDTLSKINADLANSNKVLQATASTTAAVLHETRRVSEPIEPGDRFTIDVSLEIPTTQPLVLPWVKRIFQQQFEDADGKPVTGPPSGKFIPVFGEHLTGKDPRTYPFSDDEEKLSYLFSTEDVRIFFGPKRLGDMEARHLRASVKCRDDWNRLYRWTFFFANGGEKGLDLGEDRGLVMRCYSKINIRPTREFRSYLDFDGALVVVHLPCSEIAYTPRISITSSNGTVIKTEVKNFCDKPSEQWTIFEGAYQGHAWLEPSY